MFSKLLKGILGFFLICSSIITFIIFFIVFPKIFPLVKTVDFSKDLQLVNLLTKLISYGIIILLSISLFIFLLIIISVLAKSFYFFLISNLNKKTENRIKRSLEFEEEIKEILEHSKQINSNFYKLNNYVKDTNKKINNLRASLRNALKDLQNKINDWIDFMYSQLKSSKTELFAFFQATISNYILEFAQPEIIEKIINILSSIIILFVAIWLKNPKIKFYKAFLLLTALEIPIIISGLLINKNHNVFHPHYIYYWLSMIVYSILVIKTFNNRKRIIEKIRIRTDNI